MNSPNISMSDLFEAGAHFGHMARFREPKMSEYIYCEKNRISIINLGITLPLFKNAINFITTLVNNGGKVLFVGTKSQAREIIARQAERCGMAYVNYRWLGGMLTNYKTIRQSIRRMEELGKIVTDGATEVTKREALSLQRQYDKLYNSLGGIKDMGGLPDALFVVDVGYEKIAVTEANKLKIPVVGIVDTNSAPDGIDYIIPGNDDSMRAIELYAGVIADTIIAAEQAKKAVNKKYEEEFVEIEYSANDQSQAE